MMIVSVCWADFTTCWRNARTPLLTASTPVIAVQPFENACNRSQAVSAPEGAGSGAGAATAIGCPPAASALTSPSAIVPSKAPINR